MIRGKIYGGSLLTGIFKAHHKIVLELESAFREYGLCITEFAVLEAVHTLGSSPIQKIASRVLVTSGSMSYTVNCLQKKKLIKREVSEEDRRIYNLSLTEEGAKVILELIEVHNKIIKRLFSNIEKKQMIEVTKILSSIYKEE